MNQFGESPDDFQPQSQVYINPAKSSELDRKALLVYLQNLLNMEATIEELKAIKNAICQEKERLSLSLGYRAFKIYEDRNYYLHFLVYEGKVYILTYDPGGQEGDTVFVEPIDFLTLFGESNEWGSDFRFRNGYKPCLHWLEVAPVYKKLCKVPFLSTNRWSRLYLRGNIIGTANEYMGLSEPYEDNDAADAFRRYYSLMESKGIQFYDYDCKECDLMRKDIEYIDKQLEVGKTILEDLYSLNIIPRIYRNIFSVYFVNDYVRTSTESLQAAFLHLDLDSVKKQLGEIISEQQEIIFNQAMIQAQNRELIEQNTEMLNQLSMVNEGIETMNQNIQQSNQYAKIAADNLNTCRWLAELSAYTRLFQC